MIVARKTVEIVPSLLAADAARLGEAVDEARAAGARWVSVDVMDGHFVPNLSFGPDHVRMVKARGNLLVDAHLMVDAPERIAPWFIEAGADFVTIHLEACARPRELLRDIRRGGAKAGLAVKPRTPLDGLLELLGEIDLALVMTVEPGFGGAKFIEAMLPRVSTLRRAIDAAGADCWLQVDGGINAATAGRAWAAGADSLVAGSAIFGTADVAGALRALRRAVQEQG